MRSDQHTVNGLTAYKLLTTQTSTYASRLISSWGSGDYIYVAVYKRSAGGSETYITSGAYVYAPATGLQSATMNVPQTSLTSTDSIVVRVYTYNPDYGDYLLATFSTEQLGASQLDSATWTVYYYIYQSGATYYFRFGTSTYNCRITNFSWTEAGAKEWRNVEQWKLNMRNATWFSAETWTLNLYTLKWFSVEQWMFQIKTGAWNFVEQWVVMFRAPMWFTVENWLLGLHTPKWFIVEQWMLSVRSFQWHTVENWILQARNLLWRTVEQWQLAIRNSTWLHVETWMLLHGTGFWVLVEQWLIGFRSPTWTIVEQWRISLSLTNLPILLTAMALFILILLGLIILLIKRRE